MAEAQEELLEIANRLAQLVEAGDDEELRSPLDAVKDAANKVGEAFSGSWMGYHANVYYENLKPPPAGARFSVEWGLEDSYSSDTRGNWLEFASDHVKAHIYTAAGDPDLKRVRAFSKRAEKAFSSDQSEIVSILTNVLETAPDSYI